MDTAARFKTGEETLQFLAGASMYGNLGLFVGTGFSMAVMDRDFGPVPLSWGVLIKTAASSLGVDFTKIRQVGRSYPEIATEVCAEPITDFLRMVGASAAHFARRAYGTTVSVKSLPVPPV